MPTYVYRCKKRKHRFELFHSISDESVKRCPRCKSKAERIPAAGAGILFKGSGFYITDYRSKSYKDKAKAEKSAGSSGTTGGDSKSSSGAAAGEKGAEKKSSKSRSGGSRPASSGGD